MLDTFITHIVSNVAFS